MKRVECNVSQKSRNLSSAVWQATSGKKKKASLSKREAALLSLVHAAGRGRGAHGTQQSHGQHRAPSVPRRRAGQHPRSRRTLAQARPFPPSHCSIAG
jgi:hypothetical protein